MQAVLLASVLVLLQAPPQQPGQPGQPGGLGSDRQGAMMTPLTDGQWTVVACEIDGHKITDDKMKTVTIKGNTVTWTHDGKQCTARLEFGPHNTVRAIELNTGGSATGSTGASGAGTTGSDRTGASGTTDRTGAAGTQDRKDTTNRTGTGGQGTSGTAGQGTSGSASSGKSGFDGTNQGVAHGVYVASHDFVALSLVDTSGHSASGVRQTTGSDRTGTSGTGTSGAGTTDRTGAGTTQGQGTAGTSGQGASGASGAGSSSLSGTPKFVIFLQKAGTGIGTSGSR